MLYSGLTSASVAKAFSSHTATGRRCESNVCQCQKKSILDFIVALTRPGYVWQMKMLNQHCWHRFTCVPAAGHSGWQAGEQNASSCRQGHVIDEQSSIYHGSAELKCHNRRVSLKRRCLSFAAVDHLLSNCVRQRIGKEIIKNSADGLKV